MANVTNKEEPDDNLCNEYEKQRLSFIADLRRFNENRGTPFDRIPEIGGQEVDLYHLYQRVTAFGGWQKVNYEQIWEEFQEEFALPKACVNSAQALKNIYFRYLNLYEKVNFLGEDPDVKSNEEEDGPARKKICLPIESIPLNYNYNQHKLTDAQRQQHSLSVDMYDQSHYEKLEMALRSGLPNEVDLAVNVCLLLSTEGKHCIKLEKSSQLIRLLLAHVGVFGAESDDMQDLYQHCWTPCTKRNFLRFWFETVERPDIKQLITWRGKPYVQRELIGSDVLNLGRDLGVLDVEGQRVLQTAVFMHNLSYEEGNQKILAESYVVYKFLMLSMYSTYGGLRQIALDTMANLSCELALDAVEGLSTPLVLDLLNSSLFSEDRFFLVRGLEILSKLSQLTSNESILIEHLREDVYKRLVALLTVQDIQLIVHTLETLYKLSKVGEPFTTRIARVHKAVDILVSLITIEAQSFGPGSLVGIKVVEYVPPAHMNVDEGEQVRKPTTVIQPINPDSINIYQVPASVQSQLGLAPDTGGGGGPGGGGEGAKEVVKEKEQLVTDIHATTSSWLNATYELKKKSKVNQVELFSEYLQFCRRFGINNAMSSAEFLHLVKVTYHQCEVISINRKNGDRDVFLEGLCKRSTQKPFAVTNLPPEKVRNPLSVNVSPKQAPSQVVDPLAHTPTLRQRLMEPPRVSLHPQLLHAGATPSSSSSSTSLTPAQGATKNNSQQNLASTPIGPGKVAASLHAKIMKNGKVQSPTPVKRVLPPTNSVGTSCDSLNQTANQQLPPNHKTQASAYNLQGVSQNVNSAAANSFPSITHALQMDQGKVDAQDQASVKSLLAKKLSQGIPDQDMPTDPGPTHLPVSNVHTNQQQVPHSTADNFHQPSRPHMAVSSHNATGNPAISIAYGSSPASSNHQPTRPVSQTVSHNVSSAPLILTSSAPMPMTSSISQTAAGTNESLNPSQNSTASTHVAQNSSTPDQLNINPSVIQNSLNVALAQQKVNRNSNVNAQWNNAPMAPQGTSVSFVRNTVPQSQNNQAPAVQQTSRVPVGPQHGNVATNPQHQQAVGVQLVQPNSATGLNMSMVPQNSAPIIQQQNDASVQQNASNVPCAIMSKMAGAGPQQNNSSTVVRAITPQCSLPSTASQPSSITVNHIIRNPSNMIVASHQTGNTANSSNAVTIAAAASANIQGTTVTQSISSPAVAALLTTNSQQGSQMIISTPVISGQVQRPQTISGQAPTTVVIQTPPGTIVMPSRQVVVQGNGSTAFGSIQQGGQGGTVSFIMPSQYRQGSSVTVQGLNFIQQQGSVNVVPSLALTNNTAQSQGQNIIQAAHSQQGIIQAAPSQQNLVQTSATAAIASQLGPRQIVLTPGQTTIPLGVQISSLPGSFVRNSGSICVTPQQQLQQPQQQNVVIQSSSIVSSSQSLPQQAPVSAGVTMSISNPSHATVQVPVQHSESHQPRSDVHLYNPQQPQQQIINQNVNNAHMVVTDSQRQLQQQQQQLQEEQQSVLPGQCNGLSHDLNGILGSPESVSSDLPPSPLSTGMSSDIPNGKLSEGDNDTSLKRNDISKMVEKSGRVNGFVHTVENHDSSRPESQNLRTQTPDSQSGVIVNGCVSDQSSNTLGHRTNIPGSQSGLNHGGGNPVVQSHVNQQNLVQQQGNQLSVIHQQPVGNTMLPHGQQIVTNIQGKQTVSFVQQQQQPQQQQLQPQQVMIQQQLNQQPAQMVVQQAQQIRHPQQQLIQQQIHPPQQQLIQPQQQPIQPQQMVQQSNQQQMIQQSNQPQVVQQSNQLHVMQQSSRPQMVQQTNQQQMIQQPNQQQVIIQQPNQQQILQQPNQQQILQQPNQQQILQQPNQQQVVQQINQQQQVKQHPQQKMIQQVQQSQQLVQQHMQMPRPSQPGAINAQQQPSHAQQVNTNALLQGQVRPRISTLPHQPGAQVACTSVRPRLNRDVSKDSEASNDSVASAAEADRTPQMASGQSTQTPVTPATSKKKAKGKKVEVPVVPEKLPPRSRKRKGADEAVQPGTQGPKPVQIVMEYMCEWGNCRRCFSSARLVFLHVFRYHLPKSAESSCQWATCEKLTRKRWSLVSHVQDHHCSEMAMRAACQRRFAASQQQTNGASPAPAPAPHQPMIYPPDAAMQAIRRFSIKHPYPEFADQREGPVSKHIRLTAALILRNICHCSSVGRRLIKRHEQQISYNTMNAVEASTALSNCLWEIISCCEQKPSPLKL